ncbi:MAG: aldo/keto reductase [Pseudohongiellaceae bacterium]
MNNLKKHHPVPSRALGSTGLHVSCLGLGTVKLGRNQGVRYPTQFQLPEDSEAAELLAYAHDRGINLIDTAPAYGTSESRLGSLLHDRQNWVICTKVGEEFSGGKSSFDFSAAHTRASVERSLKRLGTDYLDIVLIHSDGRDHDIVEFGDCLETLLRLQREGIVRAVGMSTKTVEGGLLAVEHTDVVMVTLNRDETADSEVVAAARKNNKGVLVKKALASGHACLEAGEDPTRANLEFAYGFQGVSSVIVGTINKTHLRQNIEAVTDLLVDAPD